MTEHEETITVIIADDESLFELAVPEYEAIDAQNALIERSIL